LAIMQPVDTPDEPVAYAALARGLSEQLVT